MTNFHQRFYIRKLIIICMQKGKKLTNAIVTGILLLVYKIMTLMVRRVCYVTLHNDQKSCMEPTWIDGEYV